MTSARERIFNPFTVISPLSPGPAPIRNTFVFDTIILGLKDGSYKLLMNTNSMYTESDTLTPKGISIMKGLKPICASFKSPSFKIVYNTNQREKNNNVLVNTAKFMNRELLVPSNNIKADINYFSEILYPFAEITITDSSN